MDETPYRASRIFRALGNPLRYRILARLALGPVDSNRLACELRRPLFAVSHHLSILRDLDLVWYKPVNHHHVYAIKYDAVRTLLDLGNRLVGNARCQAIGGTPWPLRLVETDLSPGPSEPGVAPPY